MGSPLEILSGVSAGTSLLGGLFGSDASKTAAKEQMQAGQNAIAALQGTQGTVGGMVAPYQQAGANALPSLALGLGLGPQAGVTRENFDANAYLAANPDVAADPYFATHPYEHFLQYGQKELTAGGNNRHLGFAPPTSSEVSAGSLVRPFQASDLNANLAPNWQFSLAQGQGATANALNAIGGLGGNFVKGISDYTIKKAGDLYQQAYQNYNQNQQNIFSRLSAIAGFGQNANAQYITGAVPLAQTIGSTITGIGQSQAAGTVGSYNALSGGLQNAGSWYALPTLLNASGGGGGGSLVQEGVPGQFSLGNPAYG